MVGERGGAIVITSSAASLKGYANIAHYTAAKHGLVGLMRTLAAEYGPHGIRVTNIAPTQVATDMVLNDQTYRLFCPDLDAPTIEDFKVVADNRRARRLAETLCRSVRVWPTAASAGNQGYRQVRCANP